MNALTILLALAVAGCGLDYRPALDSAMTKAAEIGGCLQFKCDLPLDNCRVRPGSCRQ